ncbi:MAG TPA: transcriptional regulator [Aquificaceae bacterium]|nr:transcriptional regulator [Aquificaceae bacterium]HIQ31121.1 transcriptional regulator [Aquifex aeolicus]
MDTKYKKAYHCPVELVIELISGKWKLLILRELMGGTRRFSQLQRAIPGITQKMLTKQLRELENSGLVQRKVYAEVPPKVEYSLTELGESLEDIFSAMHRWGERYLTSISQLSRRDGE